MKEIGGLIFNELDKACKENLGKSFDTILEKTATSNLQKRKSSTERREKTKRLQKDFKASMENVWSKNGTNSHLAQRTSFATRGQQRMDQAFETISEAKQRLEKTPPNMKRAHIPKEIDGDLDNIL